jgi:hypothetical protein
MFPRTETRIRTMFRRSVDAAIDFATLGEYGYAPAWEAIADTDPSTGSALDWGFDAVDAAGPVGAVGLLEPATASRRAPRLDPATAAARARRTGAACEGQPLRGRTLTPQLPRAARQRDGMAPRDQYCVADARH